MKIGRAIRTREDAVGTWKGGPPSRFKKAVCSLTFDPRTRRDRGPAWAETASNVRSCSGPAHGFCRAFRTLAPFRHPPQPQRAEEKQKDKKAKGGKKTGRGGRKAKRRDTQAGTRFVLDHDITLCCCGSTPAFGRIVVLYQSSRRWIELTPSRGRSRGVHGLTSSTPE